MVEPEVGSGSTEVSNRSYVLEAGAFRPASNKAGDIFPVKAPLGSPSNPAPAGFAGPSGDFAGHLANGTWNVYTGQRCRRVPRQFGGTVPGSGMVTGTLVCCAARVR